ncbi:signal transduction histidine kinase [Mycoplana sp. BE70]|uniref:sensor histidine kinase n=1 Tax=Mycoplana sp. BE70 TaxID=2817775 RepID=UPI00286654F6|nr:HAMP domain-containing sensor histidine kinase [Mycoplana sp. BE70]MDR6759373.1 signal transduction histidine kinase [Mycoplana sp. BE70]
MTRRSLRLRLALAGAASIVAALVAAFFILSTLFERHVERRIAAELVLHLNQIIAGLAEQSGATLQLTKPPVDPRFERPLSGLYWQIEGEGTRLRSRSLWDSVLTLPDIARGGIHTETVNGPGGVDLLMVEREIVTPQQRGGRPLRIAVAIDRSDIVQATAEFEGDLLPYLQVLAALLLAASLIQIVVGLRPLTTLTGRLSAIRAGRAERLGSDFPDEVLPLTGEVDGLLQSREEQLRKARSRAADLAHGFKTPLQILSGDVLRLRERGEEGIARDIEAVIERMRRHVDHEMARARQAERAHAARSDLAKVADQVVSVVARTPNGAKLDWQQEIDAGLYLRLDAEDLAEILGSLAENAARYAATTVCLTGRKEDGVAVIEVVDDGPGIPESEIGLALKRGGRLDTTSDGAGLGLSIVESFVEEAGGAFTLENRRPGLAARIVVPRIPDYSD